MSEISKSNFNINDYIKCRLNVFFVDYGKFEELVNHVYCINDFSVPCDQEIGNDSYIFFKEADGKLDKWNEEDLKKFIESNGNDGSYMTRILLNDMIRKNVIPPGNYLIQISW
jgi:hypothetical protein